MKSMNELVIELTKQANQHMADAFIEFLDLLGFDFRFMEHDPHVIDGIYHKQSGLKASEAERIALIETFKEFYTPPNFKVVERKVD